MSNPNPLVPQGSSLEQAARGKSTLGIAAFIAGAHAAVVLGLLLIGCNKESDAKTTDVAAAANTPALDAAITGDTNAPAFSATNAPPAPGGPIEYPGLATTTNPPANAGYSAVPLSPPAAVGDSYAQPPQTAATTPLEPAAADYKVKPGDIAYNIAKKNGISIKALKDANPGVDLAKLRVGQSISIPAPRTQAPAASGNAITPAATEAAAEYVVKGGDTLSRIARKFGTTPKAIRRSNNLSSDLIKVGQKLRVPAKAAAAPPALEPAPVPAPASVPAPAADPGYRPPQYVPQGSGGADAPR
jgi:LysM repeat protein